MSRPNRPTATMRAALAAAMDRDGRLHRLSESDGRWSAGSVLELFDHNTVLALLRWEFVRVTKDAANGGGFPVEVTVIPENLTRGLSGEMLELLACLERLVRVAQASGVTPDAEALSYARSILRRYGMLPAA